MLGRVGRGTLILVLVLVAGCSGDAASESAAPAVSPAPEPAPQDFSNEFIDGIGPEERAWLARQRGGAPGSGQVDVAPLVFEPVSADVILSRFGGSSGAEVALAYPQSHRIQFLKGGAARVHIWDGSRYRPGIFTSVESRQGSRICLARTRGWTGGCLTMLTNGRNFLCQYLWNNGASGEIDCRVTPIRAG